MVANVVAVVVVAVAVVAVAADSFSKKTPSQRRLIVKVVKLHVSPQTRSLTTI